MDTLMIRTIMKMDVSDGEQVIADASKMADGASLSGSDAMELLGKTALYVALVSKFKTGWKLMADLNETPTNLTALLADYYGCTEAEVLRGLKDESLG